MTTNFNFIIKYVVLKLSFFDSILFISGEDTTQNMFSYQWYFGRYD